MFEDRIIYIRMQTVLKLPFSPHLRRDCSLYNIHAEAISYTPGTRYFYEKSVGYFYE